MVDKKNQRSYLERIESALLATRPLLDRFANGKFEVRDHGGRNVVTEVDRKLSDMLRRHLLRDGEGWLSEEDSDDERRLSCNMVWVVDPLDGTREFVDGLPEWCISIGLVQDGTAVAGGTLNPATGQMFLGAHDCGVTCNGTPVRSSARGSLEGASVLASRSEFNRGEWKQFDRRSFDVQPMGSVAYKLSLVAAGIADATWTLSPKHEWDVAAGVAMVTAAGGEVRRTDGEPLRFNQPRPLLPGLVATGKDLWTEVAQLLCTV